MLVVVQYGEQTHAISIIRAPLSRHLCITFSKLVVIEKKEQRAEGEWADVIGHDGAQVAFSAPLRSWLGTEEEGVEEDAVPDPGPFSPCAVGVGKWRRGDCKRRKRRNETAIPVSQRIF